MGSCMHGKFVRGSMDGQIWVCLCPHLFVVMAPNMDIAGACVALEVNATSVGLSDVPLGRPWDASLRHVSLAHCSIFSTGAE